MATLVQLRNRTYSLLREDSTNTHFTDTSVIDGFLNEGVTFAAVFIEYPRDLVSVTSQNNIGSYTNPDDNLMVRTAYFGDSGVSGDIHPLKFVTEETLREIYPSWLDQTSSGQGRPQYFMQLDRHTIHIFPRPDAANAGKKVWINYNYVPTAMVDDSDTPDLPLPYHNLLPLYALYLAYIALQNIMVSRAMYNDFMEKINRLKSAVTKETKEALSFQWGTSEGLDGSFSREIEF